MNTYILNYNPFETVISPGQLATIIKDNRKIYQWYSPFSGTYVLKSTELLQSLAESFRGVFDGAPFILTLSYPMNMGGAQADMVWAWINGHNFSAADQVTLNSKQP
jgi:hypothetical protein